LNTSSETDFAAATRGEPLAKDAFIETFLCRPGLL